MKSIVQAWEIESLLDDVPDNTEILSLDCFDTLIWRNVHQPADVFSDLYCTHGSIETRIAAEQRARKALALQRSRNEVTLTEIYRHMFGSEDIEQTDKFVDDELAVEARHCFAFKPVATLIAKAKKRGLKVIIVSDTYLREDQLRNLIEQAAGSSTAAMIDRIFCSCEYGQGKAGGLFRPVLADLKVPARNIVHLGDNHIADYEAPQKLGIRGVHFEQFDAEASERLRLEAVSATLLEKDARRGAPILQPHRAQLSMHKEKESVQRFGHDVLGPILQGFAHWVKSEADALAEHTGKTPKLLFLLRDGFLPAETFTAIYPEMAEQVAMVELSRYTANAASFVSKKGIENYLVEQATNNKKDAYSRQRQAAYCRQMLLNESETHKLSSIGDPRTFIREVLKVKNVKKINARSRKYSQNLFAHLRRVGVEDGDCVMFVDLGYNGSVQNAIEPVLREGMNLDIAGRYLLLREWTLTGLDKKGMIDARHYDQSALNALCESIAVMEQLCTLSQGSVLGYTATGEPERDTMDIKGRQNQVRDAAQAGCMDFVDTVGCGWSTTPDSWDTDCARRMAAATLARLLFMPVESEIGIFESFSHDVNMGTKDMIKLFDPGAAAEGMRRRGLFYTKSATRMYLPGELKQQGMQALLPNFVSRRFGLDLRQSDFHGSPLKLPVTLADDREHMQIEVEAYPTSEGYFQALIPAGSGNFNIAIMVGRLCEWLQVDDASFHPIDQFMEKKIDDDAIMAQPIFEAMAENGPGLRRCLNETAFVFVPPPSKTTGEAMMLNFVFRPTILREEPEQSVREVA